MKAPGSRDEMKAEYGRYTARRVLFIAAFAVLIVALILISITVGTRSLSVTEVYTYLIDHIRGRVYDRATEYQMWYDDSIVWNYRLPRALFAVLAGTSLAVAGAAMQSVMKNPLADPYTTGISSGALMGVAISMVLGFTVGGGGVDGFGTIINAMIFAMIPVAVIYIMAPFFNRSPSTLILAGTAVAYLFNSLTDILLVTTDEQTLSEVYKWQVGSLSDVTWDAVPLVLITTIVGTVILLFLSGKLNLMSLDDKDAKSLGLDSEKMRLVCLLVLSFMAAAVISYAGIIGFVGLIVPHMVRLVIGSDNRFVIPASIVVGASFLLICDIIARALDISAAAIPVGVVTALIGSPIFLYLIVKNRRAIWRWYPRESVRVSAPTAGRVTAASWHPRCWS
ncbi:MAG: iron ABC transporter permease [Thermoplasmata archaeon]|nr:iron ABC transporter permease [Thermoplasmata archaeon]